MLSVLCALGFAACNGMIDVPDDVTGTYEGKWKDFEERITIRKDHTYAHTVLRAGKVLTENSGKWEQKGGAVVVRDFQSHYVLKGEFEEKASSFFSFQLAVMDGSRKKSIMIYPDWDYRLVEK